MDDQIGFYGQCWIFDGYLNNGYGRAKVNGKVQTVHRVVYEALVGGVPECWVLDHLCRNRACYNPLHLEPVTQQENILRGLGLAAINARKTHCPAGHPYSGDNLYIQPGGGRKCRVCRARQSSDRQARLAAESHG